MMAEEGKRVSLRKIAKWLGVPWSSVYYKPRRKSTPLVDRAVEKAIYTLIQRHPRYGYRRITIMLKKKAGLIVNKKKVQRIMQKRLGSECASQGLPSQSRRIEIRELCHQ